MLRFLGTVLFLFSASAQATDYGKSLLPKVDSATGKASFGITYAYDVDRDWSLLFTSSLNSSEISQLPTTLYWTIIDTKTGLAYQDWVQMSKNDLVVGTFGVSNVFALFKFLPNMKQSIVVISPDKKASLYFVDLKNLCEAYPKNVNDLSNSMNPKCVVESSQLPDLTSECKEWTEEIQGYLNQGLITCAIANKQLAKKGCEPLNCH